LLIILPDDRKDRYDGIKKYLSVGEKNRIPIPSQCVRAQNINNEKGS
jgi:hypothetical protein